jgi:hypothetical protein
VSTPAARRQDAYYAGVRTRPYDLVKELALAMIGTLALVIVLSAVLSSPDVSSVTIQSWAQKEPVDFVTTATGELAGTTVSSQYGPPYNEGTDSVQSLGPFSPQSWGGGVRQPVDSANDFVLKPLQGAANGDPVLGAALALYQSAGDKQQATWLDNYTKALGSAKVQDGQVTVQSGDYGPLPILMRNLLQLARSGGLDGYLLANEHFYQTDYTAPLLFMGDGTYLPGLAEDQHLLGDQWGMMNETGQYPGQSWLWLYTLWYQIPPYNGSSNADLLVVLTMVVLSLALVLVPFIPGVRDVPRWVPVHRLIWREYYREPADASPTPGAGRQTRPPEVGA